MDIAGTAVNTIVVGTIGLLLAWFGKGRFEAIDRRFDGIDGRLDRLERRVDELRSELSARMDAHIERHAG